MESETKEMQDLQKDVSEYYGKTLQSGADLKTNACCIGGSSNFTRQEKEALKKIHPDIIKKFYGCGSPIPKGIEGATVIDLGCGTGRDCYLASAIVGETGKVIGIDMTDEQLDVARKYIDYHTKAFGLSKPNVEFRKGTIEDLKSEAGIEDNTVDCVISNCVVNLSGNKEKVFREIWRVLKPGGELYFSDVYADRRIPENLKQDKVLWGECLSGALYIEDFRRVMERVGFKYYYTVSKSPITVDNPEIERQLGSIKFNSVSIKAFKIPELEDRCEDYGQEAKYLGTLGPGLEKEFQFDCSHTFLTGQKLRICLNFGLVLTKCPLYSKHFEVDPPRLHVGLFEVAPGVCGC
jgi:arsenite methyltransferase